MSKANSSIPKIYPPSKRSPILDPIHPTDFRTLNIIYCCEQCSHFDSDKGVCTIGYDANQHMQSRQNSNYERLGRVAFCRFSEID